MASVSKRLGLLTNPFLHANQELHWREDAATPAARTEDLGRGDLVKVDCTGCNHVALLTPEALLRRGLPPGEKVLDPGGRLRCRECGKKGRSGLDQVAGGGRARKCRGAVAKRTRHTHIQPMHLDLSDDETAALATELKRVIDGDRYPLSRRIRTLEAILQRSSPSPAASPCRR
jgi:hypothetical protein